MCVCVRINLATIKSNDQNEQQKTAINFEFAHQRLRDHHVILIVILNSKFIEIVYRWIYREHRNHRKASMRTGKKMWSILSICVMCFYYINSIIHGKGFRSYQINVIDHLEMPNDFKHAHTLTLCVSWNSKW